MNDLLDINIAKKYRDIDKNTIAIIKDGNTIYKSKEKGILPLYKAYSKGIDLSGASIADKVVGKGAAMIIADLNVKRVDTIIISKSAYEYLQRKEIMVSYTKLTDYIANREKDGKCPVETMAETSTDFDAFINKVKQFLKRLELI